MKDSWTGCIVESFIWSILNLKRFNSFYLIQVQSFLFNNLDFELTPNRMLQLGIQVRRDWCPRLRDRSWHNKPGITLTKQLYNNDKQETASNEISENWLDFFSSYSFKNKWLIYKLHEWFFNLDGILKILMNFTWIISDSQHSQSKKRKIDFLKLKMLNLKKYI